MQKALIFLLLLIVSVSYAKQEAPYTTSYSSSQRVILSGDLSNIEIDDIQFQTYRNTITFDLEQIKLPLNEEGQFHIEFNLNEPILATLQYDGKELPIYLEPNDSLVVFISDDKVEYQGRGAVHNEFLTSFNQEFGKYNEDYLLYEMAERKALDFRNYMDGLLAEKKSFINECDASANDQYSKAFQQYIYAEVNYWWGYYLLAYRIEHPIAKALPSPMTLPSPYYDFLNEMVLINDEALMSVHYMNFVESYLSFRRWEPVELEKINFDDTHLQVTLPSSMLLAEPDQMPVIEELVEGERLRYLGEKSDFESKSLVRGVMESFPWYKVRTACGKVGWVLGAGVRVENFGRTVEANSDLPESKTRSKIELQVQVIFDDLPVISAPVGGELLTSLSENEKAQFLHVKTTERFEYSRKGQKLYDKYLKVLTADGQEGWVFAGGVNLVEEEVTIAEPTEQFHQLALSDYTDSEEYLTGKTLFFILAKDIYWRSHLLDKDSLLKEFNSFLIANPYPQYNQILKQSINNDLEAYRLISDLEIDLPEVISFSTIEEEVKDSFPFLRMDEVLLASMENIVAIQQIVNDLPKTQIKDSSSIEPLATTEPLVISELAEKGGETTATTEGYVEIGRREYVRASTTTMLTGKLNSSSSTSPELVLYTDPILYEEKQFEINARANLTFMTDFNLADPTVGLIKVGDKQQVVYFEPGDQINAQIKAPTFPQELHFSGKGSAHNNYLLRAKGKFKDLDQELKTKLRYAEADEFKAFMSEAFAKKINYFEEYQIQHEFSTGFQNFAKAEIDYWYAFNLMNYPLEHPYYLDDPDSYVLPSDYYDFLNDIAIYTDGALPSQQYVYFLDEFISYQKKQKENQGLSQYSLIEKYFHGETRFFAFAKWYTKECKRGQAKKFGEDIKQFINACPYESFNDVLRFAYNEAKGLNVGAKAPDFLLADLDGNQVSLSDYRGKVVYLDFWATWCSPCVRMLPHSQRLQNQFKDKDVVFLYISLDKSKKAWENYIRNNKLTGVHVATSNGDIYQSKIAKIYRVKHLPAYFLIDKNGNIAQSPAKSPSSSQIIGQINSLLLIK